MAKLGRIAALVGALILQHGVAQANIIDDCGQGQDAVLGISGCTAIINSSFSSESQKYWAYFNRAAYHEMAGDYERAIADYSEVIQSDPGASQAYRGRGISYFYLGQYQRAIEELGRAIELDPDDAKAYAHRANAHQSLGQLRQAIEDYDRSIELDAGNEAYFRNRAAVHRELGQYQQSFDDYDRALTLSGPNRVREVQNALSELGYYVGAIDGIYGPGTRDALLAAVLANFAPSR